MIRVRGEVRDALGRGDPVVALESAVVTAGLPPADALEAAGTMRDEVRRRGATPAMVAVIAGELRIGLDETDLQELRERGAGRKASLRDLAPLMSAGRTAGTTVSATLHACTLATPPIRVMATGGIGGVHRGWTRHPDVSADLPVLAGTPVCVVASGAKSVLDLPATLEALESLGVPVLAWRTDLMPRFYCRGSADLPAPRRVDEIGQVASTCRTQWEVLRRPAGVLLANPVPDADALDPAEIERLAERAEAEAREQGLAAAQRTPYLLARIAEQTDRRAVRANLALLAANAGLAAEAAAALAADARSP